MQLCIPRSAVGIEDKAFSIRFKAADSIEHPEDIMDYYVSGDAVPMGRLAYTYVGKTAAEFEADATAAPDGEDPNNENQKHSGLSAGEWIIIAAGAVVVAACVVLIAVKGKKR